MKHHLSFFLMFTSAFLCFAGCRQSVGGEMNLEKTSVNATQIPIDNVSRSKEPKFASPSPTQGKTEGNSSGKLVCTPQTLRKGDVLTVALIEPHGGFLEIITPSKEYIFISSESGDKLLADARKYNLIPYYAAAELASLGEIKIDTAKATTIDYKGGEVNGKLLTARIFAESGKYKILLSKDSFETDDPTITGQCEVLYKSANE